MANITYSVSQLIAASFGISSPVFIPQRVDNGIGVQPTFSGHTINLNEFADTKQSWLGTPIVMPVKLLGGELKTLNGDGEIELVNLPEFDMPAATISLFEHEKIIGKEHLNSGKSTVKEVYGFDDWQIRMRGVCLNEPNIRTAQEQKDILLRYEQVVESVAVEGQLFDEKLIFNMMIERAVFNQLQGKPNMLPFELICSSDDPEELVI